MSHDRAYPKVYNVQRTQIFKNICHIACCAQEALALNQSWARLGEQHLFKKYEETVKLLNSSIVSKRGMKHGMLALAFPGVA